MGKILIYLSLLLATSGFAAQVNWAKDYNSAIELAKKQNKPVLFVVSRHSCKWCVYLDETTFQDKEIVEDLNKNFIAVTSYSDENDYTPKEFYTPTTPTIWFLKPNAQPMFQPIMGAMKPKNFKEALSIVKKEFNKSKKQGK